MSTLVGHLCYKAVLHHHLARGGYGIAREEATVVELPNAVAAYVNFPFGVHDEYREAFLTQSELGMPPGSIVVSRRTFSV